MPLSFPTEAEKVLQAFQSASKTVSIATLARKAEKAILWDAHGFRTEYTFDDDTVLIVRGRGKAHKVWTRLP